MKNILLGLGRVLAFLIIFFFLIILISKLVLEFPNLDGSILVYCLLLCGALIIIVMPEISEIKIFGFGIKKEDIRYPKIIIKKDALKSNALPSPEEPGKKDNKSKKVKDN